MRHAAEQMGWAGLAEPFSVRLAIAGALVLSGMGLTIGATSRTTPARPPDAVASWLRSDVR